jgi:hypothetical protein
LLAIGDEAGEVLGAVNGQQVYHSSLDPHEYAQILLAAGFPHVTIALGDKKCGEHSELRASGYLKGKGSPSATGHYFLFQHSRPVGVGPGNVAGHILGPL